MHVLLLHETGGNFEKLPLTQLKKEKLNSGTLSTKLFKNSKIVTGEK